MVSKDSINTDKIRQYNLGQDIASMLQGGEPASFGALTFGVANSAIEALNGGAQEAAFSSPSSGALSGL